jgi:hypothetical protein
LDETDTGRDVGGVAMEFGIFIQGYLPPWKREAGGADAEHISFMEDIDMVVAADKAGFKYLWASEHHGQGG